ncbi:MULTISPECIES: hypothetical protein [Microcoleaceae]|uniref:hypothetical protein n=1 Tax=Microcoleaceae TaxID=1892252 RepID=UPI001882F1A8|nr:hypothetical protein [Tychonema sp. LEGE 06208]MBE9163557.1 hypothetical protein [Tychonema sp. LEGE 06208]
MSKKLSYVGVAIVWIALLWLLPLGQAQAEPSIVRKTTESIRSETRFQETLGPRQSEKLSTGVDKKSNDKYPKLEYYDTHLESYDSNIVKDGYVRGGRFGYKIGKTLKERTIEKK